MSPALPAAIGRYRPLREVGRGGAGVVYLAEGPDGARVALKLLKAGREASQAQRRRFRTEVAATLRLRHPHVVRVLDAGEHEGCPFLALEWVEGESLGERLRRTGALSPAEAAALVEPLARALEHCHGQGILHRDLKPANVLLRARDGAPLLTDFGLARDLGGETRYTATGLFLGTPGLCPPEQARGEQERVGPRSDVWGLGALLFALLTNRPPVEGETLLQMLAELERPPRAPSALRPGLPPALDAICLRAMASEPEERYPSAGALADALAAWRAAGGGSRDGAGGLARSRRAAGLVSLGIGLVVAIGGWAATRTPEPPPPPPVDPLAQEVAALLSESIVCIQRDDLPGALERAERAAARDPRSAEAPWMIGTILEGQGDLPGAEAAYDRVIALDPLHVRARVQRGAVREARGDLLGALTDLERAIELDPQNADAHHNRAVLREARGEPELALEDLDRAIALDPGHGLAFLNRARLRHARGELAAARADYDQAIALDPAEAGAYLGRATLRELNEPEAALADYARALELDPTSGLAWANRARLRGLRKDPQGALQDYERALALLPDDPDLHLQRGLILQSQQQPAKALVDFERYLELAREDDPRRGMIRASVANLRRRLGR